MRGAALIYSLILSYNNIGMRAVIFLAMVALVAAAVDMFAFDGRYGQKCWREASFYGAKFRYEIDRKLARSLWR